VADPWNLAGESVSLGHPGGTVTLVQGSAFCISGRSGDVVPGSPQGLFFRDLRLLSLYELKLNGRRPEPLAASTPDPFSAVFVGRTSPKAGRSESSLMVFRRRYIGRGMREDITIRNFSEEAAFCAIEIAVDADFADLFQVKEGRSPDEVDRDWQADSMGFDFSVRRAGASRGVRVSFGDAPQIVDQVAVFEVIVPPRGEWSTCVQVAPVIDGDVIEPRFVCGHPVERATPGQRLALWRRQTPWIDTDHELLGVAAARSLDDLGALRIFDPEYPERTAIAAGAPWFMTVFGRDSLLTAWMALLADPDLALGVLQTLARFQGEKVDPRYEEEPGRILHEMRFGDAASLSLGGGHIYYGTADATPLFVMLLGELRRWGLAPEVVDQLLPNADRALAWIEEFGDRDGDGYVEYKRASDRGLVNQGWKDSWDGIRFHNGAVAQAPIALCEVQGYTYAAYTARVHFAERRGDTELAAKYRVKAADLRAAFNRDFWLDDKGWFAVALDADKVPVDSLTSNIGHCLWTGIVDEDKAAVVAPKLMTPDMYTGWGVRTLASSTHGYNPISYHCGSVWPHDNAIVAAGLMRYGFVEDAQRIVLGMLDAAAAEGGRLPELFSGLDRDEVPELVGYPTSCSPQAWAAGSPLLFLRTLLRLDPGVPQGKVWLAPVLPPEIGRLRVDRIPMAGARVSIEIEGDSVKVEGLPPDIELVAEPRHPLTRT
jgi:glycogen debranching enzyme